MIIAIASGKGGTGKTTVAVNLACSSIADSVRLLDCDVEEPNCHIFLNPEIQRCEIVGIPVPEVDENKCIACSECSRICQYHAIASLKTKPLVFPELCHGCGGCTKICPTGAISEIRQEIGVVEFGRYDNIEFVHGRLNIGQAMSPPLIRAVKQNVAANGITIIDCPPGTSCPVIAAVKDSDYVVLVTEPTPFGLHDLSLAVETMRELKIPFGVCINRADTGDLKVVDYCRQENIPILLEIPDDRRIAEAYSRGQLIINVLPEFKSGFQKMFDRIAEYYHEARGH
ncbi:MAG: ATP-binding protein [Desulfobacterales bacterium]|nr:ATP-binding protein [Desulfobacterales bacterium]